VKTDVSFHYFSHQAIQCPAASGHELQNVSALLLGFERPLDGFHLPSNASNPDQKLLFVSTGMCHACNHTIAQYSKQTCATIPPWLLLFPKEAAINIGLFAVVLSAFAMASTLCGGVIAIRGQKRIHFLLATGAGMLLGATFFDLLPESIEAAESQNLTSRAMFVVLVVGFLAFYIAERVLILHSCAENDCSNEAHRRFGRMSALGLIAHSTLDGAAIGAATLLSWREGIVVALAIIAHDTSDGLNTMLLVTRGERPRLADFWFLGADALAPVAGAVLALRLLPSPRWLAVFLALASGFFLYTATADLLPEAHRRSPSPAVTVFAVLGVLTMALAVGLTRADYGALYRFLWSSF